MRLFSKLNSKGFWSLPVQILIAVVCVPLIGPYLPVPVIACFYAISLTLKEILLCALPFIIFSYLFSSLIGFRQGAVSFIICLLRAVCLSNLVSAWIAYTIGRTTTAFMPQIDEALPLIIRELIPLWSWTFPKWLPTQWALIGGLIAGCIGAYKPNPTLDTCALRLRIWADFFLNRIFTPWLPLFILGFILKFEYEGLLGIIFKRYLPLLSLIFGCTTVYILFLYAWAARFQWNRFIYLLKAVAPSGISAFSTMSSAATLPLTLKAAEQTIQSTERTRVIIPVTANIHLIGDSFVIPFLALILLISFGHTCPSIAAYGIFSLYFVLNKFSVAAVPGGGILVMAPILQAYLGFDADMLSLITTLYILFDPFITALNVLGNGAFAILYTRYRCPGSCSTSAGSCTTTAE